MTSRSTKSNFISTEVDDFVIERIIQPISDWFEEKLGVNHITLHRFCYFFAMLVFGFGISKYYRNNEIIFFSVLTFWLIGYFCLVLLPFVRSKSPPVALSIIRSEGFFVPISATRLRHKKYRILLLVALLSSIAFSFSNGGAYYFLPICFFYLLAGSYFNASLSVKRKEFITLAHQTFTGC